jgi:hypothetical protein
MSKAVQRFDFYLCHMGDDVRMAYTATDAIDFAERGEPIDNNGFRRRFMGVNSYILHVNPEEGTARDVTEALANQWQADNPHETDIPTPFEPYVEPPYTGLSEEMRMLVEIYVAMGKTVQS